MKHINSKNTYDYLDSISHMKDTKTGNAASYYMDAIDTKTSSLLTHVSIMMAVISVFYATMPKESYIRSALIVELLIYLVVTLGCLRSIFIFGPDGKKYTLDETIEKRVKEVVSRLRAYKWSLRVTIITTIAFIFTLAFHFPHVMAGK